MQQTDSQEQLTTIEKILTDKKAEDIQIIKIPLEVNTLFDYLVIATASSSRHLDTLVDEVVGTFKQANHSLSETAKYVINVDGNADSGWKAVAIDSIIVHCFTAETRQNYQLEELWQNLKDINS